MLEQSRLPVVSSMRHPAFGKLVRMQFANDFLLRLTQPEASSLSFALVAVRDRISPEREIYMSPIASDAAFVGSVLESGMRISTPHGELELDWSDVSALAASLAAAID